MAKSSQVLSMVNSIERSIKVVTPNWGDFERAGVEQLREWLNCCNPSAYTFPLLLDGLSQTLNEAPDLRSEFMGAVQDIMRGSQVWAGKAG